MEQFLNKVICGDSLNELKEMESETVDLLCTDPPYGYSFMGKAWDKTLPDIGIFEESLRVLKPGSFAFVMSAPRSDVCARMMLLLEDAGFEIGFTPIYWTYASGFPKAMNIGKVVDKRKGMERKVTGKARGHVDSGGVHDDDNYEWKPVYDRTDEPATPEAKALDGSYGGFQPKPAVEVVIVAMKPLCEKTYVDQALKNGKGITWLDDCRVPVSNEKLPSGSGKRVTWREQEGRTDGTGEDYWHATSTDTRGRFPANLLVSDDVLNGHSRFFSLEEWATTLPFLVVPKASKREKNEGLEGFEKRVVKTNLNTKNGSGERLDGAPSSIAQNFHPTVKPLTLMSYLITLGSREGDIVLDPFLGSGTTALAAKKLNRNYIGIEREPEYMEIAEARLEALDAQSALF